MLFSQQLSLGILIEVCHYLRISLSAGLTLRDVFRQMATRGSRGLRPVAQRIRQHLDQGESLRAALQPEQGVFPPLFLAMAAVGEETGRLAEVMEELEKYYQLQLKSWRKLRSRSLLPVIQFVIATGVIVLLLVVLAAIAKPGSQPQGVFGLRGQGGALTLLLAMAALFAGIYLVYLVVTRLLGQQVAFDRLVLSLPAVGPCVRTLVVGRFALAGHLTLDSSLATGKALRLSLEATGNAAFVSRADVIALAVEQGETITVALGRAQVFPMDFLNMVAVGEEGGRLVEMLRHQATHYQEEAERRLKALTATLTFLIWLFYIVFMVMAILQLAGVYLGALGL
jgi:type II secretory pathway component PulF